MFTCYYCRLTFHGNRVFEHTIMPNLEEKKHLTWTTSMFPKNCSTGRIWLLSSSGKRVLRFSSQSMCSVSGLSQVSCAAQLLSSSVLSSFSLPSCPSGSGEAEHLLPAADWRHSQAIRDNLSTGSAVSLDLVVGLPSVFERVLCLFNEGEVCGKKLKNREGNGNYQWVTSAWFSELTFHRNAFFQQQNKNKKNTDLWAPLPLSGFQVTKLPRHLKMEHTV